MAASSLATQVASDLGLIVAKYRYKAVYACDYGAATTGASLTPNETAAQSVIALLGAGFYDNLIGVGVSGSIGQQIADDVAVIIVKFKECCASACASASTKTCSMTSTVTPNPATAMVIDKMIQLGNYDSLLP